MSIQAEAWKFTEELLSQPHQRMMNLHTQQTEPNTVFRQQGTSVTICLKKLPGKLCENKPEEMEEEEQQTHWGSFISSDKPEKQLWLL